MESFEAANLQKEHKTFLSDKVNYNGREFVSVKGV